MQFVFQRQFLCLGSKRFGNCSSALFRPYGTAAAVIDVHHRIRCSQFLAVDSSRILFAGKLLASEGIWGHAAAIPLTACRSHQEVVLTDLALPCVVPIVKPLEEICDNETVVAVKVQPSCDYLRFTLGILLIGNILGCYKQGTCIASSIQQPGGYSFGVYPNPP